MADEKDNQLSPAQLEIMGVVWDRQQATISEIAEEVGKIRPVSRESIMVQVLRLERRKWLKRKRDGLAYVYFAVRSREEVAGSMARHLVDAGFGGSTAHLIKTLLDVRGVTPQELAELRKLLDQADRS